jgi:tetratricopeptide (TPR) repeat protein
VHKMLRIILPASLVCTLLLADARAQTQSQTATASANCSLAINASGHAVVTVSNSCDAKLAATMQKLFDLGRDTNKKVNEILQEQQRRFDELLAAVQATNQRASQKDATPLDKQAAAALEQGDATLAIELFGQAAQAEVERAKQLVQEAKAANEKAAKLYRNQAALLRTKNMRKALAALEQALALEPDDFTTLGNAGDWAVLVGDDHKALPNYQRMMQLALAQVGKQPNSGEWQHNLAAAYDRIGNMQSTQGDSAAALKSYTASLAMRQKLTSSAPGNTQWQRDMAVNYANIGDMQREQGDSAAALKSYSSCLAIAQKLASGNPGNTGWQWNLSFSHSRIGDMQGAQGNYTAALKSYFASFAIAQKLASSAPGNTEWHHNLAGSYFQIAALQVLQNNLADAVKSLQAGLAICQKLTVADPNNVQWQVDLAKFTFSLAVLDSTQPASFSAGVMQEVLANLRQLDTAGRLPYDGMDLLVKIELYLRGNAK